MDMITNALRRIISKFPSLSVPTRRNTISDSRSEPPFIARFMSADYIHGILASAENGNTSDLFALYRDMIISDSHLQSEIFKRKLAVLGDQLTIQPFDKTNPDDASTATAVESELFSIKGFTSVLSLLLDGCLYPLSVCEKVFEPNPSGSGFKVKEIVQVPWHLLDFTDGRLMIYDSDARGNALSTKQLPDPNRYIVHRGHLLSAPDNWGGPMRSVLFWWLLSVMDREWWGRFLERYGSPFLIGKYGDDDGQKVLVRAFSMATRLGGLVVSKETDAEIRQAAASDSGSAYKEFIELCQREKSKLVLGQTLSSQADPTGLGSGVANLQGDVREDIRQFDAKMLAETVRDQLVVQLCSINNMPGTPPTIVFGSETDKTIKQTMSMLNSLGQAGLEVSDNSINTLGERMGLELQRKKNASSPFPFSVDPVHVVPFSAARRQVQVESDAIDAIAREGSADLSQAFRGILAPIARIVRDSRTAKECEERVQKFIADIDTTKPADIVTSALRAFSANGSSAPTNRLQ